MRRATNLFDNKTLAIHPYSTIFGNFSAQERAAMDVLPTTIRVSVGAGGYGGYYQGLEAGFAAIRGGGEVVVICVAVVINIP